MNTTTMTTIEMPSYSFDNDCNDCRPPTTMTESATSVMSMESAATGHSSPQKPKHHHHHEDSDETTTAYSSWIGDNSSQLSSSSCFTFRSSRDEVDDADDDDDSQLSCPKTIASPSSSSSSNKEADGGAEVDGTCTLLQRHVLLSSSYYNAVTTQHHDDTKEFHFELHPIMVVSHAEPWAEPQRHSNSTSETVAAAPIFSLAENEALLELTERAHQMLRRESDHTIDDYFHQDTDYLVGHVDTSHLPIDAICRSKMMEWSFRAVGYSFPHAPSPQQHHAVNRSQHPLRKHSIQAIQIVSQAFNLIDRLSTLHFRQNKNGNHTNAMMMDRSQYKLICMVCLHLAAKTCGLFDLYDSEKDYAAAAEEEGYSSSCEEEEDQPSSVADQSSDPSSQQGSWQEEENDDSCCYYLRQNSTSPLSFSSLATSTTPSSQCDEGQMIVSTPALSHHANNPVHQR
mmetsp:Transcript_19289/g.34856  ORF Transcript_19289/g.34856 Transcript_19289/m.34856 type:complete len:455 (-) Transcript_19289:26-1390(-)